MFLGETLPETILDPQEGTLVIHTPEQRALRTQIQDDLMDLKTAFANLRQQKLDQEEANMPGAKREGKEKAQGEGDVEELLISTIKDPILPKGQSRIPKGHTITRMERSWLKARGVTEDFLRARLDPTRPLGAMITEADEAGVTARSNRCHRGLEDYHSMMLQQSESEGEEEESSEGQGVEDSLNEESKSETGSDSPEPSPTPPPKNRITPQKPAVRYLWSLPAQAGNVERYMWLSSETLLKIDGEFDGVYRAANTHLLHFDGDLDDEVQNST